MKNRHQNIVVNAVDHKMTFWVTKYKTSTIQKRATQQTFTYLSQVTDRQLAL